MPTVSVIMPAYNAARFADTAIRSVLRQTFQDLELIVVDDGSSDGTAALVQKFGELDPRVRLLRQPHAGPGPARNLAFRAAQGRFFAFLDSDDEWADTFLEENLAIFEKWPHVDIVIGNARNQGGPHDGEPSRPVQDGWTTLTLRDMLADETCLFIMTVFRREVLDVVGGFDPQFLTNEEYEMWLRAARAGFCFVRNSKPLGWHACREDSLSANDILMLDGILRVLMKTRAQLTPESSERSILDAQLERFNKELASARLRLSLYDGNFQAAAEHLRRVAALTDRPTARWLAAVLARIPNGRWAHPATLWLMARRRDLRRIFRVDPSRQLRRPVHTRV